MAGTDILDPAAAEARRKRSLFFVGAAVAAASFTLAIQVGLNTNFLVQEIHVTPFQQGLVEAFRESCGVFALGVLALLAGFAEPLVGAAMLVLFAAGLSCYAFVHEYTYVIILSMIWSQGLHVWMPLPNSMTLALAEPGRAGHRLGQISSAGAAGWGLALAVAFALTWLGVGMRPMYIVAGAAGLAAAAACLGIHRGVKTPGPRLVFRRRYGLYYALTFLEGWRKQIFICFAPFLLVNNYGTSVESMLLLFGVIQVIGFAASPRVGRIIDRVGERRVLLVYYPSIILVFLGYAFASNVWVLYGLFIADSVLWTMAMALTTYVNRIAPKSEHTQTLSMGIAMNHVAAVTMPFAGGLLWKYLGHEWTFKVGAAAGVMSIVASAFIGRHAPVPAPAEE